MIFIDQKVTHTFESPFRDTIELKDTAIFNIYQTTVISYSIINQRQNDYINIIVS
jgi:hypothetical protein